MPSVVEAIYEHAEYVFGVDFKAVQHHQSADDARDGHSIWARGLGFPMAHR